jgi:hypothetical protein
MNTSTIIIKKVSRGVYTEEVFTIKSSPHEIAGGGVA